MPPKLACHSRQPRCQYANHPTHTTQLACNLLQDVTLASTLPKPAGHACQCTTHASMQLTQSCHPNQHATNASTPAMSPALDNTHASVPLMQACYHATHVHAIHTSMPPMPSTHGRTNSMLFFKLSTLASILI